ncbi:MAG: hypothetical protein M3022_17840 [Actinomycetota bacterium]|nr:hypothetical protein [Actinomycetota bacterium]
MRSDTVRGERRRDRLCVIVLRQLPGARHQGSSASAETTADVAASLTSGW